MNKFWKWCKSIGPWIVGAVILVLGVLSGKRVSDRRHRLNADLDANRDDETDVLHRIDDATAERNDTADDIRARAKRIAELKTALANGSLTSSVDIQEAEEFLRKFAGDQ